MKLLWLCNKIPGPVKESLTGKSASGGLWVDHVLTDLRKEGIAMHILFPGDGVRGELDETCSFASFTRGEPQEYRGELVSFFSGELEKFCPDVIHIWGTEYAYTLAMVNAIEKAGLLDRAVISIQGLCSVYAGHYAEGVPYAVRKEYTFRDAVRQDNILQQQKKFVRRGEHEIAALKKIRHVIGRTDWDRACTARINPGAKYHFCNETLREPFYEGKWSYPSCQKHRIFASSCAYPVKGFHYLLEAFAEIVKYYPDATLAVPGRSFLKMDKLRQTSYQKYLARLAVDGGIAEKIEFLGSLSAEEMKRQYLSANVFALPSTIENSPNSLGEAMLLGVPCVSADVGGVTNLMQHRTEGLIYQSTAPYMLAHYVKEVFAMEEAAAAMGNRARAHAAGTHDAKKNLQTLLSIYQELAE